MLSFDNRALVRLSVAMVFGGIVLADCVIGSAAEVRRVAAKWAITHGQDVETRIKTLHSRLRITPEQEPAWNDVAQAMRANAKTMSDLRTQHAERAKTASAPEMINAYAKTMDAHAQGVHSFADSFQTLYSSMSDEQKKAADAVFRERIQQAAARRGKS